VISIEINKSIIIEIPSITINFIIRRARGKKFPLLFCAFGAIRKNVFIAAISFVFKDLCILHKKQSPAKKKLWKGSVLTVIKLCARIYMRGKIKYLKAPKKRYYRAAFMS
jgi:hypothetical protein